MPVAPVPTARAAPASPAEDDALVRLALDAWAGAGRISDLPVRGSSMWPTLRSGERVAVRHGGAPPRLGQVIVILQAGRTIAHRVIALRRGGGEVEFRTKGDCTLVADPGWIGAARLVGVVEGVALRAAIVPRAALQGPLAVGLALLSRLQGGACAPLQRLRCLLAGRRLRRGDGPRPR